MDKDKYWKAPVFVLIILTIGALILACHRPAPPGTLTIVKGPKNPGTQWIPAGYSYTTDIVMLQLKLTAAGENVEILSITFRAAGTGNDATGIASVRLYVDLDDNGFVGSDDVPLGTPQSYGINNGTVTFANLTRVIADGETEYWLVIYDFTPDIRKGETFEISVEDIEATGETSAQKITPSLGGLVGVAEVGCPP